MIQVLRALMLEEFGMKNLDTLVSERFGLSEAFS